MQKQRFEDLVTRFGRQRIIVVGDVMLDHYIMGRVRRISPEAPVPVVEHENDRFLPGGAANVARNLAALGARVHLYGAVGRDIYAGILRRALAEGGSRHGLLVPESGRPTTVKTRLLAGHQQVVRIDRESQRPLGAETKGKLLAHVQQACAGAAAIIVADYAKGVLDQDLMDRLLAFGRKAGLPVCIDPKPVRRLEMKGCALLTPNRKETFELAGMPDGISGPAADHPLLRQAIKAIQKRHAPGTLLVTLGEEGMVVAERGAKPVHLPTAARMVSDVSGAGDTVIATFVLARAAGASAVEAASMANLAASIVVAKLGAATATPDELRQTLRE
jgi:D-beta-D-heptose 7-phosphate kinase/D-beta-D-heptose 1-phosphate adenosyltransferase